MLPRLLSLTSSLLIVLVGCSERSVDPRARAQQRRRPTFTIRGKGATFPAPVYGRWALAYMERTGLNLQYAAEGSQAGLAAIEAGTADFGASDIPLSVAEQRRLGFVQFPVVIGGVAIVFNVPGVERGALRLTPEVLDDIYGGAIRRWNDPPLKALNPKLDLPSREIIPIHRDEASGMGQLFSRFLAGVRQRPTRAPGRPAAGVRARDSAQVADFVRRFKYTLGYVELFSAAGRKLPWALLRNAAGRFVAPTARAVEAAAARGRWDDVDGAGVTLAGGQGEATWPITGVSYGLVRAESPRPERTRRVLEFFHWALTDGAAVTRAAGFVPIPGSHVAAIEQTWTERIVVEGRPAWGGGATKE